MPGRGYRTSAAGILAALIVLTTAVAGCDAHSKPTVLKEPSQTPPVSNPSAPPSSAASVTPSPPAGSGSDPGPAAPSASPSPPATSPIVGVSALNSAYPSAVAAEPAAIQVVRQFYDGLNSEIDTGDETAVSKTFQSTCTSCIDEVANIKKLLGGGHTIRGNHLHLVSVDKAFPSYSTIVTVVITGTSDAGEQLDTAGTAVRSFTAVPPTQLDFEVLIDHQPPVIAQLGVVNQ